MDTIRITWTESFEDDLLEFSGLDIPLKMDGTSLNILMRITKKYGEYERVIDNKQDDDLSVDRWTLNI